MSSLSWTVTNFPSFIRRHNSVKEMNRECNKKRLTAGDIAMMGLMTAVIVVCKELLNFLPNIELVSFWFIMFTLFFGWKIVFVVPAFVVIEGFLYGINQWWIMYLYVWPILVLAAYLGRKQDSVLFWSILSGTFGLLYGALCSLTYLLFFISEEGVRAGLYAVFNWWVAGLYFDIIHCVANFLIMFFLYTPVRRMMEKMQFISKPDEKERKNE